MHRWFKTTLDDSYQLYIRKGVRDRAVNSFNKNLPPWNRNGLKFMNDVKDKFSTSLLLSQDGLKGQECIKQFNGLDIPKIFNKPKNFMMT